MVVHGEAAGVAVASIVGDLDLSNAQEIRQALESAAEGRQQLIVSFERCGYCDSSGIAILVSLHHRLGDGLAIVVPSEAQLRRILTIVGLDSIVCVTDTSEEAAARLSRESEAASRD
ncbi:MAG: STAS domain-containing protein [Candidatus Eremiobacteraeota bacterium]|nr:STAS domain-containing protein [Candidatus Eremiobacteraeota bacterium]MBV8354910.1 STAS domain-containing protein [Candidatus Eremiobacteraeota bacterium]